MNKSPESNRVYRSTMKIIKDNAEPAPDDRPEILTVSQPWPGEHSDNFSENPNKRPLKCGTFKHQKKRRRSRQEKQADRYGSYKDLLSDTYRWMRRRR